MNINEIIQKIGEAKLKAAIEGDDAATLKELFEAEDVQISEEQLDYIAGGSGYYIDEKGNKVEFGDDNSCLFPGLSCLPDGIIVVDE